MKRIFTSLFLFILTLGYLSAQTPIGGVINNYAKVLGVDISDPCAPFLSVDDASAFNVGEVLMIIQMKGAEIDTSNTVAFGSILNLNGAGQYEKTEIDQIVGNDIYLSNQIANTYDVSSSVQVLNIPQYTDAEVTSTITSVPWDGDKGGIIALEVENTLKLSAGITTSFAGFRGGESDVAASACTFNSNHDLYYYADGSTLGDSKGEGICEFYPGKENGRGPQANGGGGGNDHNSGGGGGSNFGVGGSGGQNLNPTPGQCLGQYPGIGGNSIPNIGNRLFMGGGGGSGHTNDGNGTNGGEGGGIIYIKAPVIEGFWQNISSNGKPVSPTPAEDGAGGGGAGGTIFIDSDILLLGLGLNVDGGNGGDSNLLGQTGCMGPGGGGGGGFISCDLVSPQLFINYSGGQSGIVTNSTSGCNGQTMAAANGGDGVLITTTTPITEGTEIEHIAFTAEPMDISACTNDLSTFTVTTDLVADSYQWQIDNGSGYNNTVDGSNYTGSNSSSLDVNNLAPGTYTIQCIVNGGCNDVILSTPATLEILAPPSITTDPMDQTICENDDFMLIADASGSSVNYQWQVDNGSGFVNVLDNATYDGATNDTLIVQANAGMGGYQFQCIANNNCPGNSISNTATITIDPLPVADFTYYINGDTLFVTNNSSGEDDYYWDFGLGEPLEPGAAPYHIYEDGGTYSVSIYAVNDCGTTITTYDINVWTTSIFDTEIAPLDFTISPNPANEIIRLDMSGETFNEAIIRIYDIVGQNVYAENTNQTITDIDVSHLSSGTYLIQVTIGNKSFTRKLIKK